MKANDSDAKKIAFLGELHRKGNSSPFGHSRSNRMAVGSQSRGVCTALRLGWAVSGCWGTKARTGYISRDTALEYNGFVHSAIQSLWTGSMVFIKLLRLYYKLSWISLSNTPVIAPHITEMGNASSLFGCSSWEFIYHPLTKRQIKLFLIFVST